MYYLGVELSVSTIFYVYSQLHSVARTLRRTTTIPGRTKGNGITKVIMIPPFNVTGVVQECTPVLKSEYMYMSLPKRTRLLYS